MQFLKQGLFLILSELEIVQGPSDVGYAGEVVTGMGATPKVTGGKNRHRGLSNRKTNSRSSNS